MIAIDKHVITEAFLNLSDLQFKRQRKLKESFGWECINKKQVQDSDGFWTDYTLWYNSDGDRYMCIFGDDDLYNPMNAFPDFECETEEEAREWFDSYNGFADDEDEYYDDWADESLKEDIDISTYKEVSPENRGGTIYRLFRKVENGKGKWAAIEQCNGKDCGEPFEITYEQARGFEPMNSNEKTGMALGKKLLPRNEELSKDAIKAATLMQKVFREYPDISEEDEDYLTSLSYKDLVKEVRNRGWEEILKLDEDTVKQGKHWVNKGDSGKTHGKFKTKKAADAQRKAMFANGYKEALNKDNLKRGKRMKIVAEDFNEANLTKMGTNEYEANTNRQKHINMYRKFANLNDDEVITEDMIDDLALTKTATYCNREPARIRAEILGQRYSEYEQ